MLTVGNTLHFINRIDETNCGDKLCTPLIYYFDFFKKYNIMRHDIRYIDFNSIAPTDVVILGGGGLFDYAEFLQIAYNRLLDIGATVIAWAPGINTHTEYDGTYQTKIKFDKFSKITLRDYDNEYGLPYLPDVTCKFPELKQKYTIKRKYGVARHKDYPIKELEMYDQITNNADIRDILKFIGESEIIFSNSFHMVYWSMLMGKKTVCVNSFSTRFRSYKYKPEYCNTSKDNISECVNNAKKYDILDECIKANDDFFTEVKEIIENKLTPTECGEANFDFLTEKAVMFGYVRDMQTLPGDILVAQLYINDGTGYSEEKKRVAINNVWGDDECFVRFDLMEYPNIKELRFDPTERRFCEVEMISAVTNEGDVALIAEVGVKKGNSDYFLNTDPQYFIFSPCAEYLEIRFRIRLLSYYEAEQNVRDYVGSWDCVLQSKTREIEQKNAIIEAKTAKLNEQVSIIENQNARLTEQQSVIDNQMSEIRIRENRINMLLRESEEKSDVISSLQHQLEQTGNELNLLYHSRSWRITAPMRKIIALFRKLFKGDK